MNRRKASHPCSRREFLAVATATSLGLSLVPGSAPAAPDPAPKPGQERVFGLKFPPLDKVRLGFIGVGSRGTSLLGNLLEMEGAEIELLVLRMARQGVFGELTHGEAGYLHELRDYLLQDSIAANWRRRFVATCNGNLYPTHGLGPVAQYLGIHAGDKFDYLVSMSSAEQALSRRCAALPAGNPRRAERFACGDLNTSLIKTALGRTIMVQFSLVQSRPYSRINLLAGTTGTFCDYPPRLHLDGQPEGWITDLQPYHQRYGHPLWKKLNAQAQQSGGHGGMDYVMNWRLIECLRQGLPLDLTVYDAAAWSSIVPLSIASVSKGSAPMAVPDFTRGAWEHQPASALAAG